MAYDAILSVLDLKWHHEHELPKIARLPKKMLLCNTPSSVPSERKFYWQVTCATPAGPDFKIMYL